jgi:hypothetical protein
MLRYITPVVFAVALSLAPSLASAQQSKASILPKAGPGEKVCRHTHPSGEKKAWVCKKEEPCCAWDEINYVKCGSVTFKCL